MSTVVATYLTTYMFKLKIHTCARFAISLHNLLETYRIFLFKYN